MDGDEETISKGRPLMMFPRVASLAELVTGKQYLCVYSDSSVDEVEWVVCYFMNTASVGTGLYDSNDDLRWGDWEVDKLFDNGYILELPDNLNLAEASLIL
jgi:hypothetical protein